MIEDDTVMTAIMGWSANANANVNIKRPPVGHWRRAY
jgi:hypothetical protein